MHQGLDLRDRFPAVGALLAAGAIGARVATTVTWRGQLIEDPDLLARVDADIAEAATRFGTLSEQKLNDAIDTRIDRHDPDAVRRFQAAAKGLDVRFGKPDDETGHPVDLRAGQDHRRRVDRPPRRGVGPLGVRVMIRAPTASGAPKRWGSSRSTATCCRADAVNRTAPPPGKTRAPSTSSSTSSPTTPTTRRPGRPGWAGGRRSRRQRCHRRWSRRRRGTRGPASRRQVLTAVRDPTVLRTVMAPRTTVLTMMLDPTLLSQKAVARPARVRARRCRARPRR